MGWRWRLSSMGIEARHSYRFGYLKSEHWQCLRASKMAEVNAECFFCGKRDLSNDVHHVHYPKDIYSTPIGFLRVLCREHHERIHALTDELKAKHPGTSKGDDFKRFRLASSVIESEIASTGSRPLTRGGYRIESKKKEPKETDKCQHTKEVAVRMEISRERRLFWGLAEKSRSRLLGMKRVSDMWAGLPDDLKAEINEAEAMLLRISASLSRLREK